MICTTSLFRSFSSLRRVFSSRRLFFSIFSLCLSALIDLDSSLMCFRSLRSSSFFSNVRRCNVFLIFENLECEIQHYFRKQKKKRILSNETYFCFTSFHGRPDFGWPRMTFGSFVFSDAGNLSFPFS